MKKFISCIVLIILAALYGCSDKEPWDGYVFPDKNNLLIHRYTGKYQTREACEKASMGILESLKALDRGYYECGKNCEEGSYYNRTCDESVRGNMYK